MLVELIAGARERVGSVRASLVERRRPALLEAAFHRFGEEIGFAPGGGYFTSPKGGAVRPGEDAEHVWEISLWAEGRRFRQERRGPDACSTLVVNDTRWWDWSPAFGLRTNDEHTHAVTYDGGLALLDAAPILDACNVEIGGQAEVAGRIATRLRLVRRKPEVGSSPFEPGVDEAELMIDNATGLALRRAQLVAGKEALVLEVVDIAFDGEVDPELFEFSLPPGAPLRGEAEPRRMSPLEAASQASFTVYALPDSDWSSAAIYVGVSTLPHRPDSVTLFYDHRASGAALRVDESPEKHLLPARELAEIRRLGRRYIAFGPLVPAGREAAQIVFALAATHIRMTSAHLPRARLLELATQLEALPGDLS